MPAQSTLLLLGLCLCTLAAGQATLNIASPRPDTTRVLLISDSHIFGPQQDLQDLGSNQVM